MGRRVIISQSGISGSERGFFEDKVVDGEPLGSLYAEYGRLDVILGGWRE